MNRELPLVSIVILNFNGKKFIKDCLDTVLAQDYQNSQVIVIDNFSSDESPKMIEEYLPKIEMVNNSSNLGFARAMNVGIEKSRGDFILTLNVDVTLEPDFLSQAVSSITEDDRIGSVSGKIYRMERTDPLTIDSTGHIIFKNRLFTDRGEGLLDTGQFDKKEEIFGPCAGAALYRRSMLEDVKVDGEYFDSDFFMFLEDTDLSWRGQLRGWKSLYTPDAVAYHFRGGIAVRKTKLVEMHNYKNRYFMLIKNDSFSSIIKSLPHFIVTDTLKGGALLFRSPAALTGWVDIIKKFPKMMKKRRIIQGGRTISQKDFEKSWLKPFDYREWVGKHIIGGKVK